MAGRRGVHAPEPWGIVNWRIIDWAILPGPLPVSHFIPGHLLCHARAIIYPTTSGSLAHRRLPDNIQSTTATCSGLKALHSKVRAFLEIDQEPSERILEVTSAAWHAEQDIPALCHAFDDPVSGIPISPDGYIVIHIAQSYWPEIEGELAVASGSETVLWLVAATTLLVSPREHRLPNRDIAQVVRVASDLGRIAVGPGQTHRSAPAFSPNQAT